MLFHLKIRLLMYICICIERTPYSIQSKPEKLVHSRAYHKAMRAAVRAGLGADEAGAQARTAARAAVVAWVQAGKPSL